MSQRNPTLPFEEEAAAAAAKLVSILSCCIFSLLEKPLENLAFLGIAGNMLLAGTILLAGCGGCEGCGRVFSSLGMCMPVCLSLSTGRFNNGFFSSNGQPDLYGDLQNNTSDRNWQNKFLSKQSS